MPFGWRDGGIPCRVAGSYIELVDVSARKGAFIIVGFKLQRTCMFTRHVHDHVIITSTNKNSPRENLALWPKATESV